MRRGLRARRVDAGAAVSSVPSSKQMFEDRTPQRRGREETKEGDEHEKETLRCQESNKSLVLFAVFLLSPPPPYLLWRSLISCRPNVDFILELGA